MPEGVPLYSDLTVKEFVSYMADLKLVPHKKKKEAIEKEENTYEKFKEFDRDKLTEQQKDIYDVYEYQNSLSEKLNDDKYDYYEPAFQSMTGIHYQIPTLFSDWELRNEKDVSSSSGDVSVCKCTVRVWEKGSGSDRAGACTGGRKRSREAVGGRCARATCQTSPPTEEIPQAGGCPLTACSLNRFVSAYPALSNTYQF